MHAQVAKQRMRKEKDEDCFCPRHPTSNQPPVRFSVERWAQAEEPDPYADPDAEEGTGAAEEPEEPEKKLGAAPRSELRAPRSTGLGHLLSAICPLPSVLYRR